MSAMGDFLELASLDRALNNTGTVGATTLYIALFVTVLEDDTGTAGTEVSGGAYARDPYTSSSGWTTATASGVTTAKNANAIVFATNTSPDWGTIIGFAIYDAVTGGSLYYHGEVIPSVPISVNDTFEFAVNALVIEHQ